MGKGEFPCAYAGRVFIFFSEENLQKFIKSPKYYLQVPNQMPKRYNISLQGARGSGKHTIAKLLSQKYGWKIIDPIEIVAKTLEKQKNFEKHIPSNWDPKSNSIHFSENEFKELQKGSNVPLQSLLPLVYWEMGLQLQKRVYP